MESVTRQADSEAGRSSGRKRGPTFDDADNLGTAPKRQAPWKGPALPNSHYTVAIICPLPLEWAAALAMLDEEHQPLLRSRCRAGDNNTYRLGSIHTEYGAHYTVIVGMWKDNIGNLPAGVVAQNLAQSFPEAKICLVVGIAGGIPSLRHPLYLGDVVVGTSILHYDPQRVVTNGVIRTPKYMEPPPSLLSAVSHLETRHERSGHQIAETLTQRLGHLKAYRRPLLEDTLFEADCLHTTRATFGDEDDPCSDPCKDCDPSQVKRRRQRRSTDPNIHYGCIGSGDTLMRSSEEREKLGSRKLGALCFEMESAGVMAMLPCLTIRGIADYSDSHKNNKWQRYAAATAASYARELLESIPPLSSGDKSEPQPPTIPPSGGLSVPLTTRKDHFLASLRFDRMDLRRQGIDAPESSTCEWLLEEPHVIKWLDDTQFREHNGLLLLTGNAGTGKSTCVNYLFDWHKRQRPPDAAAPLFASFFFHNRGIELEKSVVGMYRALLLQLFTGYPDLLALLDLFSFQSVGAVVGECPPLPTLKHLFREALLSLKGRSFVCYVDALDEGDVQDVRDMATFFQTLATDPAVRTAGSLRVMFSSRPYPVVTNQWRGVKFALQEAEGHRRDLEQYVRDHLQDAETIITKTIIEKANGVFLWVKLVARIFFDDYLSQGRPCDLDRLRKTPNGLKELFRDMLERDKSNWDEFAVAMTWVLYARRPLRLIEFSVALDLGMEVQQHGSFDSPKVTSGNDATLRKRVLSASKGLAEVVDHTDPPSVQLIHESAQEFLKNGGLDDMLPASDFHSPIICHGRLANYCLCLLQNSTVLGWLESAKSGRYYYLSEQHGFTLYAACWGLDHANESKHCIPPGFIRDFPKKAVGWHVNFVGLKREHDWSILHECADSCYHSLFKYGDWTEQRKGVHIDAQTEYYDSPLHLASRRGHLPIVQILVDWGANIDLRSTSYNLDRTPLMKAILNRNMRVVEWLLAQGADIHIVDSNGETALHFAAEFDSSQVIAQLLARRPELNQQDADGVTPLMTAIYNNHPRSAKMLIDAGATLTEPYGEKEMQLVFAIYAGDAESCQSLVTAGASLEARNNLGQTPLVVAAERSKGAVCQVLVHAGADLAARDIHGRTPLFVAAERGEHAVVQVLVHAGADLEAQDDMRRTPLFVAAEHGKNAVCQVLVHAGADLEVQDYMRRTPLFRAVERGKDAVCQVLVHAGADLEVQDYMGRTPLLAAAEYGRKEVVQLLIHHGASVNHPSRNGVTPFMSAAMLNNSDVVELLLGNGADIYAQNNQGKTALDMAKGDVLRYLQTWLENTEGLSSMSLDDSDE